MLDTNIYVSTILFGGNPKNIIESGLQGKIQIFISSEILTEIKKVLERKKFGFSPEVTNEIINEIEKITEYVVPRKKHTIVIRDFSDNIIIDCAVEAAADYIISGDNDLLTIREYKNIKIANPSDFIKIIS